mgnify:CR=1 FL=1
MSGKVAEAAALIWCPFPDAATAESIATEMLDEQLVACANIMGPVRSLFVWQGERSATQEVGVLFKTDAAVLSRAIARLEQLHPYECPAIAGWRCDNAPAETLAWLAEATRQ